MGKPWNFPKKVPVVFPSGSFRMYFVVCPAVWSQCTGPGKFKKNLNDVPKIFLSGTFGMPLPVFPRCTTFGAFSANPGNIAKICSGNWKTGNILNVSAVFPGFAENAPKVVHHGNTGRGIPNVPLRNIFGTSFQFFLNFPGPVHWDHTAGHTTKYVLNEPLGNTTGTFFGKFQGFPMDYLIRTLWSHDQGNCKCTEHFPSMSHSGILYVLSLGKFKVYPQIT